MDENKRDVTNSTIEKMILTGDSAFCVLRMNNVKQNLYKFRMNTHRVSGAENNPMKFCYILAPSEITPFGKFYETYFGDILTTGVNYFSIFGVSKAHILNAPKKLYEDLIYHVNRHTHTEVAHYLERLSLAMFHPIPERCLVNVTYTQNLWNWMKKSELTNSIVIDDVTLQSIRSSIGEQQISQDTIEGAYFRNGGNLLDTIKELQKNSIQEAK
jgi:hypothetical protein